MVALSERDRYVHSYTAGIVYVTNEVSKLLH